MTGLLITVFVASLVGSLHCIGMCGPFALVAGAQARRPREAVAPAVAYSLGRLLTYSVMGVTAGALGYAFDAGTRWANWQHSITTITGWGLIAFGVIALLRAIGWLPQDMWTGRMVARRLKPVQRRIQKTSGWVRAGLIGAVTVLMPCGWLYAFVIAAAATAHPFSGWLVMFVFWAGNVPILAALMLGHGLVARRIQRWIPISMATLVIAAGAFALTVRAPVQLQARSVPKGDLTTVATSIENLDTPECCHHDTPVAPDD